jgi:hypothetical protein
MIHKRAQILILALGKRIGDAVTYPLASERQGTMQHLCVALLAATVMTANAQEIATCRDPSGRAYYHFAGLVKKADARWQDDKISDGVITLTRNGNDIDILFLDTRRKPISSTQDGAKVVLLRAGQTGIEVLVHYPEGAATEIYSFFKESDGSSRFTLLQNKTGAAALIPKSSVMVGTCDAIRFDVLTK